MPQKHQLHATSPQPELQPSNTTSSVTPSNQAGFRPLYLMQQWLQYANCVNSVRTLSTSASTSGRRPSHTPSSALRAIETLGLTLPPTHPASKVSTKALRQGWGHHAGCPKSTSYMQRHPNPNFSHLIPPHQLHLGLG